MQVIPPIEITDARLTSSAVPEEIAATYDGATAYAVGDLVGIATAYGVAQDVWRSLQAANTGNALVEGAFWAFAGDVYPIYASGSSAALGAYVTDLATHSLYESLAAGNTGNALTDETKWKYVGKTNRFRLFDYTRSDQTVSGLSLTAVITPGKRINSIGLKGILANAYAITVTSVLGGGTVYSASGSLNTRETVTWSDYFFGEFSTQKSLVFFDVPPLSDSIITITMTATSGSTKLGAAVFGSFVYLGVTLNSPSSDILNFSTIARDTDGNAILTARRNVPKSRQTVVAEKANVNKIRGLRDYLNAVPALWYGLSDATDGYFESVSILGIYKAFEINVENHGEAIVNLELEEV